MEMPQLHLSGAYALLNLGPETLLRRGPLLVGAIALASAVALAIVARVIPSQARLATRAVVALVWGAAIVVQQQKYYPYHFTPLFGFAVVCGAWAAGELCAAWNRPRLAVSMAVAAVALGVVVFHGDVARNSDPLAVRLGDAVGADARVLVSSVYSHGLCTAFDGAPRCVWPESFTLWLPYMATASDAPRRLEAWAREMRQRVEEHRPDVLALSTSDQALPDGLTPARLLLEQYAIVDPGEYVRLPSDVETRMDARGWLVLRRHE
jgi:hypothetical protein